jgi:hypothetical protein
MGESELRSVFITEESRSWSFTTEEPRFSDVYIIWESRLHNAFTMGESDLRSVFITEESRPWSYTTEEPRFSDVYIIWESRLHSTFTMGSQNSAVYSSLRSQYFLVFSPPRRQDSLVYS